jgi:hypothetical protein
MPVPLSSFLTTCNNSVLRNELFSLYKSGEAEAMTFAAWNNWKSIKDVCEGGALWWFDGTDAHIKIPADANHKGAIFHELFHAAFFLTPLWSNKANINDGWDNAFCDAFRYFIEVSLIRNSPWLDEIKDRTAQGKSLRYDKKFPDPILFDCGKDYYSEHYILDISA